MNPRLLIIAGAALAIVGLIVGTGLFVTKDNKIQLQGKVLGVRSHQVDANGTVAVVDYSVTNPSTNQFQLEEITAQLETSDGKTVDGEVFSEPETARLFEYYPMLGQRVNKTFLIREQLNSGQSREAMAAIRFDVPDAQVTNRKGLRIRFKEADGIVTEIVEARP
jgi:hypothetical protein